MRLYLLPELRRLLELCGLSALEAYHYDNGVVYTGAKGAAVGLVRGAASRVPRLRSHIFVRATAAGAPDARALERTAESFRQFGLPAPARSASPCGRRPTCR